MRVTVIEKISLSHVLTALAYHLSRNLWLDDNYDRVMLEDDLCPCASGSKFKRCCMSAPFNAHGSSLYKGIFRSPVTRPHIRYTFISPTIEMIHLKIACCA
ncbi:YecA family protein [Pseudomonas sp. MDT1-85]